MNQCFKMDTQELSNYPKVTERAIKGLSVFEETYNCCRKWYLTGRDDPDDGGILITEPTP